MEQEDKRTGAADCHGPSQKLSFLLTCAADSQSMGLRTGIPVLLILAFY
jgi:hypothetical protein